MTDLSSSTADAASALIATLEMKRARVDVESAGVAAQLADRQRVLASLRSELEGVERMAQRLAEAEALAPEPTWDRLCSATAPAAVLVFVVMGDAPPPPPPPASSSTTTGGTPGRGGARSQQPAAAPPQRVVLDTVTVGVPEDSPLAGRRCEVTLGETVRTLSAYLRGGGFIAPGSTDGLTEVLHTALDLGLDELAQMVRDFVVSLSEAE
jgi:hypothetical protein